MEMTEIHKALADFRANPATTPQAKAAAGRLAQAALDRTVSPEIVIDGAGDLSFDLRNRQGQLIFCEVSPEGRIEAGLFTGKDHETAATASAAGPEIVLGWISE